MKEGRHGLPTVKFDVAVNETEIRDYINQQLDQAIRESLLCGILKPCQKELA